MGRFLPNRNQSIPKPSSANFCPMVRPETWGWAGILGARVITAFSYANSLPQRGNYGRTACIRRRGGLLAGGKYSTLIFLYSFTVVSFL